MSNTPPIGFGFFAATFNVSGGTHEAVNTYGFKNAGGLSAAGALSNFSASMTGTGHLYAANLISSDWTLVQEYCLVNNGGVLFSDTVATSVVGTGSWDSPPPGSSAVCRKLTAQAGRQYRGRVGLPAGMLDEADLDVVGNMSTGFRNAIQAFATASLTATTTNNVPMYLLHGPNLAGVTPVPTQVTSLQIELLTGTQRRRLRR